MALPSSRTARYWFPAKRYGWGWGLPHVWQGWAVFAAYLAAISVIGCLVRPDTHLALFTGCMVAASALLTGACWLKGEPPGWRWHK